MESLAALGVAASTAQFVTFASGLVSNAIEISGSASGATSQVLSMEVVYTQLKELASTLAATPVPDHPSAVEGAQHPGAAEGRMSSTAKAIQELSQSCRDDCEQLLDVTTKLKAQQSSVPGRKWESFRVVLKTLWKKKDIQDLEERLARSQTALTLHICKATG
jgi:hypothetical protein